MLLYRKATVDDISLLAKMNQKLVQDEQHRNRFMILSWLEELMRAFLTGKYKAVIFEVDRKTVAYALFCDDEDHIYLRQFYVSREYRRQGIGREAIEILRKKV